MRNLREHWVSEVLDHEAHAVGFGPASTENRAGLRLAGFQRDARPTQLAPKAHEPPIVRAFIQKQRFARRNAVNIDRLLLEVVWERLLDVENHAVNRRMLVAQS